MQRPPADSTPLLAALEFRHRGWAPIDVPHQSKNPDRPDWQNERLDDDELRHRFGRNARGVGILLGQSSAGLTDIDLDAPEALALADEFLQQTHSVFGRPGKPRSHRLYVCEPVVSTRKFMDPVKWTNAGDDEKARMLVELRSTGAQTIFPPSLHEGGELIAWAEDGEPTTIDGHELLRRVSRLAAASLLMRHWPLRGSEVRHECALALAGALNRHGWGAVEIAEFIGAIARAAGDEEAQDRVRAALTTADRLATGGTATGLPRLREILGEAVVGRMTDWLGLPPAPVYSGASPQRLPAPDPWPEPLAAEALYGFAGDFVRAIAPFSEADPVALLGHLLAGVGVLVGGGVHAIAGDAVHPAKLNAVVVGETAKGRKGSAQRPVERLLREADPSFAPRIMEGLSSGEGLIWGVRDPIRRLERGGRGSERTTELVEVDPGVSDKRLLAVESEFASVLRAVEREGNTLSAVVRRAWDRDDLRTLTKNSPAMATGAHIGVVGHITRDELLRYLDRTEVASGFANRFLWLAARRGQLLPDGEMVPAEVIADFGRRLAGVVEWAREPRHLTRDPEAASIWRSVYPALAEGQLGMFGAATSRAEAQALRLSLTYAILDRSPAIRAEHLLAALAVWRYAEDTARWLFGDALGDPTADTILAALRSGGPLTRVQIWELFGRNVNRARLDRALGLLVKAGRAVSAKRNDTGGRSAEVWMAL